MTMRTVPTRGRISHKILAILALSALLCAALTGLAASSIHALSQEEQRLIKVHVAGLRLAAAGQEHLTRIHQLAFQMVNEDEATVISTLADRFQSEARELAANLAGLRPLVEPEDQPVLATATVAANEYVALAPRIRAAAAAHDRATAIQLMRSTATPTFDRGDGAFDALVDGLTRDVEREATAAEKAAWQSIWLMIGSAVIGLLAIGAFTLVAVQRWIAKPLGLIADGMQRLMDGDMTATVPETTRADEVGDLTRVYRTLHKFSIDYLDAEAAAAEQRRLADEERERSEEARALAAREQAEAVEALGAGLARMAEGDLVFRIGGVFPSGYAKLRDDFNAAIGQLQEAMTVMKTCILGIRASADEISQSAEDLSRRTEQQAASLEETAAALDQITNTVRRTAESSAEASNVVLSATTDAERSSIVVRDAVNAMGEIEQSAQQISQIIGVIDEIAFQTNLLALNAGVEAARAGDAGRGFAVVASEVRALAQRSAVAAKEIKSLISTSGRQVASGVQLVGQTGQALERILIDIGEVNTLVAQIAASAAEQAESLNEVNGAVDQMDHGTQQNASMAEENTAASFALASEAQQLADLIDRFEIGAVAQPHARRRRAPPSAPPSTPPRPARLRRRGASAAPALQAEPAEGDWEEF